VIGDVIDVASFNAASRLIRLYVRLLPGV